MDTQRFVNITEEINQLLDLPVPPPAEKHLLREKIFALKFEQLGLAGDMTDIERDQAARDFTLAQVPQNVFSYPMHLREQCMPISTEIAIKWGVPVGRCQKLSPQQMRTDHDAG